jgi:hypothetical protein
LTIGVAKRYKILCEREKLALTTNIMGNNPALQMPAILFWAFQKPDPTALSSNDYENSSLSLLISKPFTYIKFNIY